MAELFKQFSVIFEDEKRITCLNLLKRVSMFHTRILLVFDLDNIEWWLRIKEREENQIIEQNLDTEDEFYAEEEEWQDTKE